MTMYYILDDKKHPVLADFATWSQWFETAQSDIARMTCYTELTDDVHVSTVFLSIDHRFDGNGAPILYETMVFGGPLSDSQERYTTRQEARLGHEQWVQRARAAEASEP